MPRSKTLLLVSAVFLVAVLGSLGLHRHSALHDTDAYFHLAVARAYSVVLPGVDPPPSPAGPAQAGLAQVGPAQTDSAVEPSLPDLRFSILGEGLGDKEFLFHALLAPWVALAGSGGTETLAAGRWALAVWAGILASLVAWLAMRAVGPWGALMPFWLAYAAPELSWRLVRLRPELLSLAVLLLACWAMAEGHDRRLGVLAWIYTLGYTAFHAFLGLVGLVFLVSGWKDRQWRWGMVLYATLGCGLGLLLHPHFPKNLEVWWVQNVQFFADKSQLDVGTEIGPNTTAVALMVNLGWYLGLALLAWASRPAEAEGAANDTAQGKAQEGSGAHLDADARLARIFGIATWVFGGLYLLMSRFSIYFIPFATLWCLFELRRRGRSLDGFLGGSLVLRPGSASPPAQVSPKADLAAARVSDGTRGRELRVPTLVAIVLCLLVSLPQAWQQLGVYHARTTVGPQQARLVDREQLSAALPAGAKVAANWGPTATYLLWAPQGRYLNALDPVFMARPHARAYAQLRSILEGREPDTPAASLAILDSDYLAFPTVGHGRLLGRLAHDPRVQWLHRGSHQLVRFRPGPQPEEGSSDPPVGRLELDWRIAPPTTRPPLDASSTTDTWPRLPRPPAPRLRQIQGYVDAEALAPDLPCLLFVHNFATDIAGPHLAELSARGAASVWLDGQPLATVRQGPDAVLGQGVALPFELDRGSHRLEVLSCELTKGNGKGFYWRW